MVVFTFLFNPFWQISSKKSKLSVKAEFGTNTNSNMQNSMIMFTFPVISRKCPSLVNYVQKLKIVLSK